MTVLEAIKARVNYPLTDAQAEEKLGQAAALIVERIVNN